MTETTRMDGHINSSYVDDDDAPRNVQDSGQHEQVPNEERQHESVLEQPNVLRGDSDEIDNMKPTLYEDQQMAPDDSTKRKSGTASQPDVTMYPAELTTNDPEPTPARNELAVEYSDPPQRTRQRSILRNSSVTHPDQHYNHSREFDSIGNQSFFIATDDESSDYGLNRRLRSRELGMLLSFAVCLILVSVCAALIMTEVLGSGRSSDYDDESFYTYMYSMASLLLAILLGLGATGHLTKDDHYKHRRKSAFIRGGMMVLGSGTVIYRCLLFIEYVTQSSECHDGSELMLSIPGLICICCELAFLLVFTKVRMNSSILVFSLGRFVTMHMVATNICVWLAVVVKESLHEIHIVADDHHYSQYNQDPTSFADTSTGTNGTSSDPYCPTSDVLESFEIYLFPLIIEYSVMVSTMWLSLWDNCGAGWLQEERRKSQHPRWHSHGKARQGSSSSRPSLHSRMSVVSVVSVQRSSGYRNTNLGFIFGWMTLIGAVVVTFLFLYMVHSDSSLSEEAIVRLAYGSNMVLTVISIIAIPVTVYGMSCLDTHEHHEENLATFHHAGEYHEEYHHNVDKNLLLITFLFLVVFKLLCIMSAIQQGELLVILDGVLSILLGIVQTAFINGYAFDKVSMTEEQRRYKPGRQGLEFLRCTELSLWLINTFLLKNTAAKGAQYAAFGTTAWAILGNIFQPLTILHYFHCMTCVASVIGHAYSDKYIGKANTPH